MLFIRLLRYIRGYVQFVIEGGSSERFLNLTARSRIPVWNICKTEQKLCGCTFAKTYKKLRPFVRKSHSSARIEYKTGFPFLLHRYRKRMGFAIGVIVLVAAIGCSGLFVWDIEVQGNKTISSAEIAETMKNFGLSRGKRKSTIDVIELAEELCLAYDEISWAAINLIGTVAYIEVVERVQPPQIVDESIPCNIVAEKGGRIYSIDVYEGEKLKKAGDIVKKGDILVSGILEDKNGKIHVGHARAKVIGQFTEIRKIVIPMEQTKLRFCGSPCNRVFLSVGKMKLPASIASLVRPPQGVTRQYRRKAALLGVDLPFYVIVEQTIPAHVQNFVLSEAKAKQMAIEQLVPIENCLTREGEIVERKLRGTIDKGAYILNVQYICRQEIGKEEEILIEN